MSSPLNKGSSSSTGYGLRMETTLPKGMGAYSSVARIKSGRKVINNSVIIDSILRPEGFHT